MKKEHLLRIVFYIEFMEAYMEYILAIIFLLFGMLGVIVKIIDFLISIKNSIEDRFFKRKKRTNKLEKHIELSKKEKELKNKEFQLTQLVKKNENIRNSIDIIIKEKSIGFPWLANAFADLEELEDLKLSRHLQYKKYPAHKAAAEVRRISKEKKNLIYKNKKLEYILNYYETLFPQLTNYKDQEIDDDVIRIKDQKNNRNKNNDSVKFWLTDGEYDNLSDCERNQLALDRYKLKKKNKLEIGLAYERYIGYLHEQNGFHVEYYGIKKGFNDLGIDLICKKEDVILLIQCKNWSIHKEIHENVVNQIFGTTYRFVFENIQSVSNYRDIFKLVKEKRVVPTIFTSTNLSDRAKDFARVLDVKIMDNIKLIDYPLVKCNMSKNSEKIYHLPFDQQYDKINILKNNETFYVETVKEAERLGYRRAYRWRDN